MTSISPGTSADGGPPDPEQKESRNPLSGFFKGLTSSEKKTRDGQPAKRRGPKPDSKPALTRRQELNRQAQRTHRERKELYIKALEQEVLRLKDHIVSACKERDNAQEENRVLKELLARHGIDFTGLISPGGTTGQSTFGDSSTGSVSGSYGPRSNSTGFTSPPNVPGGGDFSGGQLSQFPAAGNANDGANYDQVGIDFVLTLENPCMDHAGMLMGQAQRDERDFHGHAGMLCSAPESHLIERPDVPYNTVMPETGTLDLMKLLELSNRLPLDGEITPVMAWAMVLRHPRIGELNTKDFETLRADLLAKVRCYGFGAVLEEFEVRDALSSVFATKIESYAIHQIHEDIRHYG